MQRIRTLAELEFSFPTTIEKPFIYQLLSAKAKELYILGMNYSEIARHLGVTDKTVKKAIILGNEIKRA